MSRQSTRQSDLWLQLAPGSKGTHQKEAARSTEVAWQYGAESISRNLLDGEVS